MRFTLSWLHEMLPSKPTAPEVAKALTSVGIEVTGVTYLAEGYQDVVVARIEAARPHPNADRLTLCTVTDGSASYAIVCGAKNFKVGDHAALAKPGASLPNGLKIKASKIRGETSDGMLCSESELKLTEESEGILILAPETRPGEAVALVLGREDWGIEVEVSPNRGDCLSVLGLARETAAALEVVAKIPSVHGEGPRESSSPLAQVLDAVGAPRYALRGVEELKVGSSPAWLSARLEAAGVRSINSVVDITNYVMLERGQPMHAFDAEKVKGVVQVRRAIEGEKITCLDGVERLLTARDLVIADERGLIAIAGVMGGLASAVGEGTRKILLESAFFDPKSVRATSRRLGLISESSYRFERTVDRDGAWSASERVVELLGKWCGGRASRGVDILARGPSPSKIHLRKATIRRILGSDVEAAGEYLNRLGLSIEKVEEGWRVEAPSWRSDLEREIDLVEEVARLHGYDQFKSTLPSVFSGPSLETFRNKITYVRSLCMAIGLSECRGWSFMSEEDRSRFSPPGREPVRVLNPIASELTMLRQSLLPSLLATWVRNRNRQVAGSRLFEIGTIFAKLPEGSSTPADEQTILAVLLAGAVEGGGWPEKTRSADFFDAKGVVEALADRLGWGKIRYDRESAPSHYHPGMSASLKIGGETVGALGVLHPRLAREMETTESAVALEIRLDTLLKRDAKPLRFEPLSPYPAVRRDLAFIVSGEVSALSLADEVEKLRDPLLREVRLFDVYEGKGIPEGKKSLAFALMLQAADRTLTESEVEGVVQKAVTRIEKAFQATLRGGPTNR